MSTTVLIYVLRVSLWSLSSHSSYFPGRRYPDGNAHHKDSDHSDYDGQGICPADVVYVAIKECADAAPQPKAHVSRSENSAESFTLKQISRSRGEGGGIHAAAETEKENENV